MKWAAKYNHRAIIMIIMILNKISSNCKIYYTQWEIYVSKYLLIIVNVMIIRSTCVERIFKFGFLFQSCVVFRVLNWLLLIFYFVQVINARHCNKHLNQLYCYFTWRTQSITIKNISFMCVVIQLNNFKWIKNAFTSQKF